MTQQELRCLAFLQKDPLRHVQPLEALRHGTAEILAVREGGLLLYDLKGQLHMLCADNAQAVRELLPILPEVPVLVSDNSSMDGFIMRERGFTGSTVCSNVVYLKKEPPRIQTDLELRPLPDDMAQTVSRHYHLYNLEEIQDFIRQGSLLGGYRKETLVGFLGWHEEGSMGMLYVFEQYRRQGYAYAMEALQIKGMLSQGKLPYGQVAVGNDASLALQRRLGFSIADRTVSWLYRD